MWHPKKILDPFLTVFSHFFMSYFDVFGSIFEKSAMTDLPNIIVSMCLVSYNFCMIPHVWALTFGLNLSGAWGVLSEYCTTLHSGATPLLRGFSRKNIFCQKIFDNFFSFQATEMVLTSKWGRIQQEIQIWPDQVVAASWRLVRSPKHAEKMLIQLIMPTEPSSPAVQWGILQILF